MTRTFAPGDELVARFGDEDGGLEVAAGNAAPVSSWRPQVRVAMTVAP